jgi:hypothetical protein
MIMNKLPIFALAAVLLLHTLSAQTTIATQYCGNPSTVGAAAAANIIAPWYCSQINQVAQQDWQNWIPIGLAFAVLSFMIAVLIFMVGIVLRNERVRTFGVGEMYEAIATTLIVAFFLLLSAVMFGILPGLFVGPIDPFNTSLIYIAQEINATSNLIVNIFDVGTLGAYYASQQLVFCIGETDGQCDEESEIFPPLFRFAVLYGFYWPTWALFDLTIGGFLTLNVEFYLILFFMYAAIPAFLIPGIIFRSILPTRHLGGMMMAIALGFYFVMPILFSVAYYFTSTGPISTLNSVSAAIHRYGSGSAGITNAGSPGSPLVLALDNAKKVLGSYWLSVLFFPALIIALTYALITQMAELIGGMARTSGRLRGL